MPELVNTLDHGVRTTDPDSGRPVRLRAGEVRTVEGALADELLRLDGVEEAGGEHREAWDAQVAAASPDYGGNEKMLQVLADEATRVRAHARMVQVAVPLNQVIGDNDAPLGPPSGTITTKQAVARMSPQDKHGYADHERLPEEGDLGDQVLSPTEVAQAEAKRALEEVHVELLQAQQEQGLETVNLEPEQGPLSTVTPQAANTGDTSNPGPEAQASEESPAPRRRRRETAEPAPEQPSE